jgi:hypothetical protein
VIRRSRSDAGRAQLSNASRAGRARARLWALRAWPRVSEWKHRCTGVQLSGLLTDWCRHYAVTQHLILSRALRKSVLFRLKHRENLLRVTARFWWRSSLSALCTNLVILNALRIVNIFPGPMDYCNGSLCPLIWLASSWSQIPPDVNSKLIGQCWNWDIC